jgi:hypothetical protein
VLLKVGPCEGACAGLHAVAHMWRILCMSIKTVAKCCLKLAICRAVPRSLCCVYSGAVPCGAQDTVLLHGGDLQTVAQPPKHRVLTSACALLCCASPRVLCCIVPLCAVPVQYHGGECPYLEDKRLGWSHPCGVMECPKNCKGGIKGKASLCRVSLLLDCNHAQC